MFKKLKKYKPIKTIAMFVTLYKTSPEGFTSVEIEQQYLPDALSDSLKIPDQYKEDVAAGWEYQWQCDDISERQLYGMMKERI